MRAMRSEPEYEPTDKHTELEAEGKGTKASEGKCGNVKRGVVVTGLFLWSIYSKTCSDILHKAVSYRY